MREEKLILAGGFGSRLKGAIPNLPKPLAPINGVPLLKLQLDHWIRQGQRSFVFLLHHEANAIIQFLFQQSKHYGDAISIRWLVEDEPLGTGGSVANAVVKLKLFGTILISNADTWLGDGLLAMRKSTAPTIAITKIENVSRYGSIEFSSGGFVTNFVEKKNHGGEMPGIINAGLYKLPSDIFVSEKKTVFSIESDILPKLVETNLLRGLMLDGTFFDIGIPADYYKFCDWQKTQHDIGG